MVGGLFDDVDEFGYNVGLELLGIEEDVVSVSFLVFVCKILAVGSNDGVKDDDNVNEPSKHTTFVHGE